MQSLFLAIRSLFRFRLYILINIIGLGLSLTCVITLCRYIYQELTTDHFIRDLDRVYYIIEERGIDQRQVLLGVNRSSGFEELIKHPGIELYSRFICFEDDQIEWDNKKFVANILATDSTFLQIVTYPVMQAQQLPLLSLPEEAVITRQFARKIFGDKDPLGEKLIHSTGKQVIISGILDEPHTQVSFPFDILIHADLNRSWSRMDREIVRLYPNVHAKEINRLFSDYKKSSSFRRELKRYQLYPVRDFYLDKQIIPLYDPAMQGNSIYLNILSIVVILLLIIGAFNFINTYTTLLLKREREFGMKKVFGANLRQVYGQILFENVSMVLCALFVAWIMNELFSGLLWNYLGVTELKSYSFNLILSFAILLLLPVITSIYPFIRYRYSLPVQSLKQVSVSGERLRTKNSLLFLQYMITCSLIIFSLFFIKQLHFMLSKDPGFHTENILRIQLLSRSTTYLTDPERDRKFATNVELLNNEIKQNTIFKDYYFGDSPMEITDQSILMGRSKENFRDVRIYMISKEGLDFWGLTLLKGDVWEQNDHYSNEMQIIVNETAWKIFGFSGLEEAWVESQVRLRFSEYTDHTQPALYKVIGVVKDFHIEHLSQSIPPVILYNSSSGVADFLNFSINPLKKKEGIHFLKELNEKADNREFNYTFISDKVAEIYKKDKQITTLCSLFAFFAILISALGLFSLSLFDIRQKLPEVGIRKVNGAQPKDIFRLFMRKYMMILFYAFVTACLLTRIGLYYYLLDFAYNTAVSWWIFAIAFIITAGITWLTLFYQIRKAADSNPAQVIKSE